MNRATTRLLAIALVLQHGLPLAAAHEHMKTSDHIQSHDLAPSNSTDAEIMEPSYFRHPEYAGIMYAHISLMILAWVFVLPLAVMLSIARSRLSLFLQAGFHFLNGFGIFLAIIYNARTPNLYERNVHHSSGWAISFVVFAWTILSVVNLYYPKRLASFTAQPLSREAMAEHHSMHSDQSQSSQRWSHDSGQGTERNSVSLFMGSRANSLQNDPDSMKESYRNDDEYFAEDRTLLDPDTRIALGNNKFAQFLGKAMSIVGLERHIQSIAILHTVLERFTALLAFFALTTGMVTYAGIFHKRAVFGGLAHFIKGGIFFWYGLLTLGRWLGCFSDFGWAWNIKPDKDIVGRWRARIPTAEFTESFVIFLYGASNVFLEHLGGWGKAWSAQDLEHVSITIMFFGGGLLGMLVESHRIRKLLSGSLLSGNDHLRPTSSVWSVPNSYVHPLNPMPALVIMLLGIMMSSHHQHSEIAAAVHAQWGTMFVGFAIARGLTYVTLWIKPPSSYLPTRPPTEIISSFCLTAGGIIFMASNGDTVKAIEANGLDAMIVFTIVMGLASIIMAWSVCLIAMKAWAAQRSLQHDSKRVRRPFA